MMRLKKLIIDFSKWEYTALCLLILIVGLLHFSTILQPNTPVFDEKYYVPAARSIIEGHGTDRIEHPPLAQLIIASGIRIFGDNPLGWRIFSVIFGIIGIVLFYLICRRLGLDRKYAYLAAFFLSFENLSFVQSGIAMLDVFSLTFMLASFWFYLRGSYAGSGVMVALGILAKLTGVLAIPIITVHWLITNRKKWLDIILFLLIVLAAFWLLMPLLEFLVWHKWLNPFSQVKLMLEANAAATFASRPSDPMLSRPWDWLIYPKILTYWIDPHYIGMISPTIWALIIPAFIFIIYKTWQRIRAAQFALIWFAGAYLIWIPVSLITDRMSYIFYFYPAVGAICVAISLAAEELDRFQTAATHRKWAGLVVPVYLLLCLVTFAILSPIAFWWKFPFCVAAYAVSRYYLSKTISPPIIHEAALKK